MTRTAIDIDDRLSDRVMRYRLKTKREAVALALRGLVGEPLGREAALALDGTGWGADDDELRALQEPWRT